MQIGKQDQSRPEMRIFRGLRLFHLHYQVRFGPNIGRIGENLGASVAIILVRKRTAFARVRFHQDLVAGFAQRNYAAWNQANTRFVIFYFLGDADDHRGKSVLGASGAGSGSGACDCAVIRFGPRPMAIKESEFILPSGVRFWSA